jgi:hypothetical protein
MCLSILFRNLLHQVVCHDLLHSWLWHPLHVHQRLQLAELDWSKNFRAKIGNNFLSTLMGAAAVLSHNSVFSIFPSSSSIMHARESPKMTPSMFPWLL